MKSIRVVKSEETPGLGDAAIEMIVKEIIARQTTAVDAVTGATNSSNAVKKAVEEALKRAGGVAYLVFDEKAVNQTSIMQTYKAKGYFVEAPTLNELAKKFSIDPAGLGKTASAWHQVYDTKVDPAFGRKDSIFSRLDEPPYYGQKISPASQTTYGGLVRDMHCRVLRTDGSVIPGLQVAGEAASQFGQGLTVATVLGRLAGTEAAKEVESKK